MKNWTRIRLMLCFLLFGFGALYAAEETPSSAIAINPLLVGSQTPGVVLKTPEGESVTLTDVVKKGPTVLVFYRGSW